MHWLMPLLAIATVGAAAKQPHIVMLFVDDLGYGDLGFTGHPSTQTPNLDKLAALGKRLTSWYSAYPVCSASRAALLTGRQPPRVGMPGVINSLSAAGLPLNETTVADYLRSGGYQTLAIGKWHQGQQPQYLPRERGFDVFHGLPFSVDDGEGFASQCDQVEARVPELAQHTNTAAGDVASWQPPLKLGPSLPLPLIRQSANESVIEEQPANLVPLTAKWWNTTREFLRGGSGDRSGAPKFAYIAFGHVHTATPNVYPEVGLRQYAGCAFQGLTGRGPFGDALAEVDWFVGRLVDELESLGMAEDTLILFASDNGPSLRWGIGAGSAGPFTGGAARYANGTAYTNTGKGSTWEGGIRMPAFAYWPGRVAPHSRSDEVVSTLDVLPSLLKIAGLPPPPARGAHAVDGRDSLADILLSRTGSARSKHDFLPFYNGYFGNVSTEIYAARAYGRYKAHWITAPGLGGGRWPTDAHSAPELLRHDPPLVFDVQADPSENFPLAPEQLAPGLLARLEAHKATAERGMVLRSIDMRFGFEWALCCGVGCSGRNGTCDCRCSNAPLPLLPLLPPSRV